MNVVMVLAKYLGAGIDNWFVSRTPPFDVIPRGASQLKGVSLSAACKEILTVLFQFPFHQRSVLIVVQ